MQVPRCQAIIRMADRPWGLHGDDVSPNQMVDISIIAAIAVALGLSGRLTAVVDYDDELVID